MTRILFAIITFILLLIPQLLFPRMPIVFFLLFIYFIVQPNKSRRVLLVFLLSAIGALFISPALVFYPLIYHFFERIKKVEINIFYLKFIYFSSIISLFIQIFYFGADSENRYSVGTDPNFTGIFFLLIGMLGFRLKKYLSVFILLTIGVLLTQSRLLLLSSLLLLLSNFFINYVSNIITFLTRFPLLLILVVNSLFYLFTIALSTESFSSSNIDQNNNIVNRSLNITDNSNLGRILANAYWLNKLYSDGSLFKSDDVEKRKDLDEGVLIPHNSLIYFIVSNSLVGLFLLIFILKSLLDTSDTQIKFNFFLMVIVGLFLHGMFSPVYLILFCIVSGPYSISTKQNSINNQKSLFHLPSF
jgi:hypothetical protein